MMHEAIEIRTYRGKRYTVEALSKELNVDVTKIGYKGCKALGIGRLHYTTDYNTPHRASFEYITIEGTKRGWQFGERVFFDTEEERDAKREEYRIQREESKYRTELLNKIKELRTEDLEAIVKMIIE